MSGAALPHRFFCPFLFYHKREGARNSPRMIFKLFLCSVLRLPAERAQGGADLLPAVAHALQGGHRAAAALLLAELAGKAALDQAVQRVLRRGGESGTTGAFLL